MTPEARFAEIKRSRPDAVYSGSPKRHYEDYHRESTGYMDALESLCAELIEENKRYETALQTIAEMQRQSPAPIRVAAKALAAPEQAPEHE